VKLHQLLERKNKTVFVLLIAQLLTVIMPPSNVALLQLEMSRLLPENAL
jgi:hypothetical protein